MLRTIIRALADGQQAGQYRFLVIGGFGLDAHHYHRDTRDVDIVLAAAHLQPAEQVIRDLGYLRFDQTKAFTRYWHPDDPAFLPVDFMLVDADTFTKLAAGCVAHAIEGVPVQCPSVASFIALKLHALRNNPARARKDLNDIAALVEKNPGVVTMAQLKELCDRYAPSHIFAKLQVLLSP